jgi:hypothetical protein
MGETDSQEIGGAPRATDLIADFHARREAWRRQGENLERLRADARAAAALEAAAILTSTRGEIRRVVGDARRRLLELTAQLQAITEQSNGQGDDEQTEDVPYSVVQARRDLARLLTDMRPELDDLEAQSQEFSAAPPLPPSQPTLEPEPEPVLDVEFDDVEHDAALAAIAPLFEKELDKMLEADRAKAVPEATGSHIAVPQVVGSQPVAPVSPASSTSPAPHSGMRGSIVLLALVGLTVLGGVGWWASGYLRGGDGLAPPIAAIPNVARGNPAWQADGIPTLTASLVALPTSGSVRSVSTTPDAVSLDVEVRRTAWVESAVDDGTPQTKTFEAGESFRLLGARGISITVRDAGALVVSLNGGPRSPLGPDGQVLTRHFMPGDAVSP